MLKMLLYWEEAYIVLRETQQLYQFASKENGTEVNNDETEYMVMSRDQNAEINHNIVIDNNSFERMKECEYIRKT